MPRESKVRISGLVAAANRVREQLKLGIPTPEASKFRRYVRDTLQAVEQICATAHQLPEHLPTPSRNAYAYLKTLDLQRLPIADGPTPSIATIRIASLRSQHQQFQTEIFRQIQESGCNDPVIRRIRQQIEQRVHHIEASCQRVKLTPEHLSPGAKPIYAWLQFLRQGNHLSAHLEAVHRMNQKVRELQKSARKEFGTPKSTAPRRAVIAISFDNLTGLFRYRHTPQGSYLQINEGFIKAGDDVLAALAISFMKGKTPATNQMLRKFSLTDEYIEILLAMDWMIAEISDTAKGNCHDLVQTFERVNQDYFSASMEQPKLCWSQTYTRRKFGHYEPARDRVVLSRTLDNPNVPAYVLEFVLYHELLHKKHGETWVNGRQRVHTAAFRREERQFRQYEQAETALKDLARHPHQL